MGDVRLVLDRNAQTLYARREGAKIVRSREAEHDHYLIINMDADGNIVGAQLLMANEMPTHVWREHPDRYSLPGDILSTIDDWMTNLRAR